MKTAGASCSAEQIFDTIKYIMSCGVPYEFRTTVVKELHTPDDILSIAKEISGADGYFLQLFEDSGELIENGFSAHDEATMRAMLELAKPYVKNSGIRGM